MLSTNLSWRNCRSSPGSLKHSESTASHCQYEMLNERRIGFSRAGSEFAQIRSVEVVEEASCENQSRRLQEPAHDCRPSPRTSV